MRESKEVVRELPLSYPRKLDWKKLELVKIRSRRSASFKINLDKRSENSSKTFLNYRKQVTLISNCKNFIHPAYRISPFFGTSRRPNCIFSSVHLSSASNRIASFSLPRPILKARQTVLARLSNLLPVEQWAGDPSPLQEETIDGCFVGARPDSGRFYALIYRFLIEGWFWSITREDFGRGFFDRWRGLWRWN